MIITKKALPRRTFLRGAGATLALPLLDAMIPAHTALAATAGAPVRRLGFVYIPMGANMAQWTPKQVGTLTELSPILRPFAPVLDQMTVLSNMELQTAYPGTHATANCAFLSATRAKMTESSDYRLATTVDQVAAKRMGQDTPLPSLELAMDLLVAVGQCDNGFACVYQNNLSWSSPTTPLPYEAHPRIVFERLFGDGGSASTRIQALKLRSSILDWVNEDVANLQRKLGPGDKTIVSEYLDTIREVERRIQKAETETAESHLPDLERPVGVPIKYADHAKLMFDLQLLAFQGDVTRVITFQMAREQSVRTYPEAGVPDAHHPTSHHGGDPEKLEKLAKINTFHMSLFANFLEKLKNTRDGDGSLLDHSLFLCGSGMGNPSVHSHSDLPAIVIGGAAGKMKGGRHVKYAQPTPLANLLLTILDKVGIHQDSFGDSNGHVDELLAL